MHLLWHNLYLLYLMCRLLHGFSLLGLQLTDKWFVYAAGLQFLFSQGMGSLLVGVCGLFAGFLYRFNIMGLKELVLPSAVVSFFKNTIGVVLQTRNPQRVRHRQRPGIGSGAQMGNVNVEVDQQLVQQLMQMGFDQQIATYALQQTNNNLGNAVQLLLQQ
eukprot:TRINITY_DN2449_c0_g3_i1.p5 TRINITY_DN2449_c0_g3~~TRINITY_DN2449_c0_g3_i1.p5  ORF type:complete len:160 (+),score=8.18 TRINITY_DN2449_c0_g3_i1:409-888(+)